MTRNSGYLLVRTQKSRERYLDFACHQTQVAEISNAIKIRRAGLSTTKDEALCSSGLPLVVLRLARSLRQDTRFQDDDGAAED